MRKKYKRRKDFVDLIGVKFGGLLVTGYWGRKNRASMWNCLCDCGNIVVTRASSLKNGKKWCSPECSKRPEEQKKQRPWGKLESLTGRRFGRLEVVKRLDDVITKPKGKVHRTRMWMCRCDCGVFASKSQSGLLQGFYKRCGRNCEKYDHRCNERGVHARQIFPKKDILVSEKFLYFIQCREFVKIGITENVERRIKQISTSSPDKPELIAAFRGVGHMEKELHERFSHLRTNGEWFVYTDEIKKTIYEMESMFRPS